MTIVAHGLGISASTGTTVVRNVGIALEARANTVELSSRSHTVALSAPNVVEMADTSYTVVWTPPAIELATRESNVVTPTPRKTIQ